MLKIQELIFYCFLKFYFILEKPKKNFMCVTVSLAYMY